MHMTPGTGSFVPSASLNLSGSSEHAASAASELDEVPTHVRSEHRLK